MLSRLNILIFIDHYLPGYKSGGPMRTTANTVEWLGDDFQFRILTRDRDYRETMPYQDIQTGVWHRVGKALVRYLAPQELTLVSLLRILRETPHDLIYLNSTFSTRTVVVLLFARLGLICRPIVLASRGSLSDGALGLKPVKKRIYLTVARILGLYNRVYWHSTSDEETRDIRSVFGKRRQLRIAQIPNLPMPVSNPVNRTRTKQPGSLRIVMLSRIARMKNLELMAAALDGVRGAVHLDFWGPIEDPVYWEESLKRFHSLSPNIQVHHCGSAAPDQVNAILSEYELFFMPSLSENFGHAILEALCAGCPVLISDRTPWNAVSERGAGWALALDRPDQFREIIQHLVDADDVTWQVYSQQARQFGLDYLASSRAVDETRRFLIEAAGQSRSSS